MRSDSRTAPSGQGSLEGASRMLSKSLSGPTCSSESMSSPDLDMRISRSGLPRTAAATISRPLEPNTYAVALRATAIIGGSTVVTVAFGLVRIKAMALLLGPSGFGLFGMYLIDRGGDSESGRYGHSKQRSASDCGLLRHE